MCCDNGLELYYHNHNWEIVNNLFGFNILMNETDPKYMSLVVDVGWVTLGGADPIDVIKQNYGRVKALHFKEFTADNKFTELGSGIVNFKGVCEIIKDKHEMWVVSEQDETVKTPLESAKENRNYLCKLFNM